MVADRRDDLVVGFGSHDVAALAFHLPGHRGGLWSPRMARTTVQLCGRFVVELAGRRVEQSLPGRRGRLLFAFLALNRDRPVARSELVEAVWSSALPRDPPEALAALLSKVRTALGGDYVAGRSELTISLPVDAVVDVERAFKAVHEAESACARADWPRAWSAALESQLVARRRLLPEFESGWIDEWRRSLEDVRVRGLECYAAACLATGGAELPGAERAARELVQAAPLRESGYGLLMRALEARGNVAEALLVYETARERLRDELGTSPAEALQSLHRRLLRAGG
jgi:SARP family transcriptional regulator, regulator of embCAB operon